MENRMVGIMQIAILHRFPRDEIVQTNAAFPFIAREGVDVLTFKAFNRVSSKWKFVKSLIWIFYASALIKKKYDVIYCDDSFPFYPIFVKLFNRKSKVVLRLGDFHLMYYTWGKLYKFLHFFERIGWKMADEIYVISKPMATLVKYEIGDIYQKVKIILDPVNPDDFPIEEKTEKKKIVMFHGLLIKNKNVDVLLQASHILPDVEFWIVGDGPDKDRLTSLAGKNVIFFGWKPFEDIPKLISQCDVGVATRSTNLGNQFVVTSPFLQYSVMAKPCIVSRRIVFEDMGYKHMFVNALELAQQIEALIDDKTEGKKMREYILENHNAEEIGDQIWNALTRV